MEEEAPTIVVENKANVLPQAKPAEKLVLTSIALQAKRNETPAGKAIAALFGLYGDNRDDGIIVANTSNQEITLKNSAEEYKAAFGEKSNEEIAQETGFSVAVIKLIREYAEEKPSSESLVAAASELGFVTADQLISLLDKREGQAFELLANNPILTPELLKEFLNLQEINLTPENIKAAREYCRKHFPKKTLEPEETPQQDPFDRLETVIKSIVGDRANWTQDDFIDEYYKKVEAGEITETLSSILNFTSDIDKAIINMDAKLKAKFEERIDKTKKIGIVAFLFTLLSIWAAMKKNQQSAGGQG